MTKAITAAQILESAEAEIEASAKYLEQRREALRRAWLLERAGGTAQEVRGVLVASGFLLLSVPKGGAR